MNVGCEMLRESLLEKRPKRFLFGHIHEARGEEDFEGIQCLNISSVDRYCKQLFPPMVFNV